jgi:hypothetical protein
MLVYADSTSLVIQKIYLCERPNPFLFFSVLLCFAFFKDYITRGKELSCLYLLITSTEFLRLDEDTVATVLSVKACWGWRCRSTNF